ncbi:oligogalacturonate lyase family protein [Arcticibacter eurypsychrophilus]|uniref:oligogalacturonate lyase family protein n=1 Tax=Arcticibacter eurypsychrophilus TaxID=1434752 RepID=UPI00084D43F1|nr:oligogalacturonate lyase family protein [Arcticibacter eurypsychrophilus]
MKLSRSMILSGCFLLMINSKLLAQQVLVTGSQKPMPAEWIDKDTGHKIVRLSGKTGPINNWYFHNNPFLKEKENEGDKMVFSDTDGLHNQVFTLNLKDKGIEQVTSGVSQKKMLSMTSPKTREIIYQTADSIYATNIDSKKTRLLYVFPAGTKGAIATINADATLFAGSYSSPEQAKILQQYPLKSQFFNRIYDAHLLNSIFTVDIKTGKFKVIHEENNWLGHIQFSPTDPNILMFCHEGPWDKVDRIWRYKIKTEETTLMHKRTMPMEIAGHEFFQPDGKVIWFDLQKPRGKTFYLAGADVNTGKEMASYEMTADEWSIHFAVYPDKNMFAGDGGDSTQVAKAKNGMWIYAFYPEENHFRSERLVNMKDHNYRGLEPNVHFSPDGKWIIFGGNFEGNKQTYAVEIAKSE